MTDDTDPFVRYYADESLKQSTLERFSATKSAVMRAARHFGLTGDAWSVADIGCGAATQCALWARDGHQVHGTDINAQLVELGQQRATGAGLDISLTVGSATRLPWPDASMDICLCPELLEHVAEWEQVLSEAVRVLRPGGVLYLSTTNALCPVQEEFDLPGYSWYPPPLKRRYERLAITTRPELANHARYPAVNWFTYFQLRRHLRKLGLESMDRFDVAALGRDGLGGRVLGLIRAIPPLRWMAHVATPYTVVFARKSAA